MSHPTVFKDFIELTKPRILTFVLITTVFGYYLGAGGQLHWMRLVLLILGAGLVCAGASVLNHYVERDFDKRMARTRNRPLPSGRMQPSTALNFGILLILSGLFVLYLGINLLTAFLSLLTAFLYIVVYTPMKRLTWLNTTIGAIPGAIPPMGGWVAATGQMEVGAWILFFILFIWQHPHFYSIGWLCRADYKEGGFVMLPVIDPTGERTFRHVFLYSLALIPVSLLPSFFGISGPLYAIGAAAVGFWMIRYSLQCQTTRSNADAKNLLKATVYYLPILFVIIIVDLLI